MEFKKESILRRNFKPLAALTALAMSGTAAVAAGDGFYSVEYSDLSIDLTQIGGYGELVVKPSGFGDLGFGACVLNFTRNEDGGVAEAAPVVQQSSAQCPSEIAFTLGDGEKGMKSITFTSGGALAGETLDLFPVLLPMSESLKVAAPAGFDILGLTIGMSRKDAEAQLTAEGYGLLEGLTETVNYDGYSRAINVWGKGKSEYGGHGVEDAIGLTYTSVVEGEAAEERLLTLARNWDVPSAANLSVAVLEKSLVDKHGASSSTSSGNRFYDRAGTLVAGAFQPVCAEDLYLQSVEEVRMLPGESEQGEVSPRCGAEVKIMVIEDFQAPGRARLLKVSLSKGDVAYEDFWNVWSRRELTALQARYELQANMTGAAPKL